VRVSDKDLPNQMLFPAKMDPCFIVQTPSFFRVSTATQLVSQVSPPSSEYACSKRQESLPFFVMTKRTRIIIGALGGMVTNGIIGLFIGPVVLAVGYELFWTWVRGEVPPVESDG